LLYILAARSYSLRMTAEETWKRAVRVWETDAQELARLPANLDRNSFTRCVEIIAACKGKIVTMGCGTSELVNLLPALKAKKAFLIAVTENERSPLAEDSGSAGGFW